MHTLLQTKNHNYTELKPWAFLPMLIISGLFLFAYWRLYKYGSNYMKSFVARKEREYRITVVYTRYGITLRGKISGYDSLKIHLQLFLGYFLAYFFPLIIVGIVAVAIPDSWFGFFFKKS